MTGNKSDQSSILERHAGKVVLVFVLLTPFLIYTALQGIKNRTNQIGDWLPQSYSETQELLQFRKHFVSDQFVVVSWDGCTLGTDPRRYDSQPDDPRIEALAKHLMPDFNMNSADEAGSTNGAIDEHDSPEVVENRNGTTLNRRYFKSVTTARQLLNQLTSSPTELSYKRAVSRLKGSLIGYDEKQTCVIITLTDEAVENFRAIFSRGTGGWLQIYHPEGELLEAMRECGIEPDSVHLGGPPIDSVAIDEEGESTLYRLATFAAIIGLTLSWISLRSIRLTLIVFSCGLMSAIGSVSVVWITGETTDAFLMAMPSLVFVLAISGAVHLIKYYRDEIIENGIATAPQRAILLGWKPTLLCSVTTAIGLLALLTSDLTPVRKFGTYSAIGVMMMLSTLFVFLPAALQVWPLRMRPAMIKALSQKRVEDRLSRFDMFWQKFGGWIVRHHGWVTVVNVIVIVAVGVGITRVQTNIDMMKLFEPSARIRSDYQWLESNVSRLVPVEVVLRFKKESLRRGDDTDVDWGRYDLLERIEAVSHVHGKIDATFGVRGDDVTSRPISAATFVIPIPKDRNDLQSFAHRSVIDIRLNESYQALIDSGYLAVDEDTGDEIWRVSVRVAAFRDIDYGEFTGQLREAIQPVIDYHNRRLDKGLSTPSANIAATSDVSLAADSQNMEAGGDYLSVSYTGVIPIIYKAQRALLDSLIESTFWSFVSITPLLMLVSRGFWAGWTATLPNSLPVLVVFGGMGWLDIPVTIGSMMSASIALGVAVDDTIHYLLWYRRTLNETGDREKACLEAYRRCATPTLQAALISGFGLAVFVFSTFTPTEQFGLLMLAILLTGVVAELVLLPALLAGPLGKVFQPRRNKS